MLSKDGVVINMIDNISKNFEIDLDNINSDKSYDSGTIYSLSKYYLQLITQEMASRFQHFGKNIVSNVSVSRFACLLKTIVFTVLFIKDATLRRFCGYF